MPHPAPSFGWPEVYRGLPMLRASEAMPRTQALLERRFGPLEFIAAGGYGEVWRTSKGRVIKATASQAEAYCVTTVLDAGIHSPWLPEIFSAGWFSGARFTWCEDSDSEEEPERDKRCPLAASAESAEPVFWYEREEVTSIPPHVFEMVFDIWRDGFVEAARKWTSNKGRKSAAWRNATRIARAICSAMAELPRIGLFPIDSWPANWGLTRKGQVVLRDLACGSADEMYDDSDQNTEVPVLDWPPSSTWDEPCFPREVGAPPVDDGVLELRIEWPDLFAIFETRSKEAWKTETRRYREARAAVGHRLLQLLQQRRALEITDPQRKVAYVAMLQRDGIIRLGRFDSRGPVGHVEIPSGEGQALELAEDLARNLERHPDKDTTTLRILSPGRSLVDFWMKQPLGKWGTKALEIIQTSNALRARGEYEEAARYEQAEREKLGPQPAEAPVPDTVGGPSYADIRRRLRPRPKRLPAEKLGRPEPERDGDALVEPGYVRFRNEIARINEIRNPLDRSSRRLHAVSDFLRPFGVHGNLISARVVLEIALSFWPAELLDEQPLGPFRWLEYARWRTEPGRDYEKRPMLPHEAAADDYWDWDQDVSPLANEIGSLGWQVGETFYEAWMGDSSGGGYVEGGRRVLEASAEALTMLLHFGTRVFLGPPGEQLGALDRWWLEFHRRLALSAPERIAGEWWQTRDPDVTSGPRKRDRDKPYNAKDDRLAVIAQIRIREKLERERTVQSGTLQVRLGQDATEEWDWTAFEGVQLAGSGRTGRIVMDLPSNPAAGLVWADIDGEPKIVAFWTEELMRRMGVLRALIDVYRRVVSPRVVVVGPFSAAGRAAARALADVVEDEPETTTGTRKDYLALKEALELPSETNLVDLIERLHPHVPDPSFQPWVLPPLTPEEQAARDAAPEPDFLLSRYRRARIREAVHQLFGKWHGYRRRTKAEPGPGGDPLVWRCVGIGVELMLEAAGHLIGACHERFSATRHDEFQRPLRGAALEAREREDLQVFAYVRRTMDLVWDWFQHENPTQTFWPVVYQAQQQEQLLQLLSELGQPGLERTLRTCGMRTMSLIRAIRDAAWNLLTWVLGHREQGRNLYPSGYLWDVTVRDPVDWPLQRLQFLAEGWADTFDVLRQGDRRWPWFINEVARRCRARIALRLERSPLAH